MLIVITFVRWGREIVAFFVSLVVLCYKVQWGRGMMAFCVSLGVLFYYKARIVERNIC